MPKVRANNITINYEQQGSGEPLVRFVHDVFSALAPARRS